MSITSAFQGESILLFGMFDPPGEIVVVVVQGPPARETVLRKERFLGLWLNTGRQSFDDVPAYYAIAASQPLQRLLARGAGGEILSLEDRLVARPAGRRRAATEELTRFRGGLVEVKRREGLYPAAIGQVTVQAGRLFRVELPFPSRLPEGVYEVTAYLLREGRIVAAVSRPLPVGKVGFSAQLAGWAGHEGALYGLGAIVMALLDGLARRRRHAAALDGEAEGGIMSGDSRARRPSASSWWWSTKARNCATRCATPAAAPSGPAGGSPCSTSWSRPRASNGARWST